MSLGTELAFWFVTDPILTVCICVRKGIVVGENLDKKKVCLPMPDNEEYHLI